MLGEYLKRKNKNRNQLVAWLASMNVLQLAIQSVKTKKDSNCQLSEPPPPSEKLLKL